MEIIINGEQIDTGNAIIAITRQAYDFSDLQKRFVGRTNQFSIPRTSKNQRIFKRPTDIGTNADSFERVYKAIIVDQGVTILKGNAILEEAGDTYKIQVVDRAKDFFLSLDQPLRNLDTEDSDMFPPSGLFYVPNDSVWLYCTDMQHTSKSISKTILNSSGGVILPVTQYTRPHFVVTKLIGKIFDEKGWSFEPFAGSEKLDKAIISANHSQFYYTSYQKPVYQVIPGDGIGYRILELDSFYDFKESSIVFPEGFSLNINTQKAAFRFRGSIVATGNFTIQITGRSTTGADVQTFSFPVEEGDTEIDLTTGVFETDEPDMVITVGAYGDSGTLTFNNTLLYNVIDESTFPDFSTNPMGGFGIKAHDNLPDISQIDFLREIWSIFGIGIQVAQIEKKVFPFAYSQLSRDNTIDWSDKYIFDSQNITLIDGDLGKKTKLEYDNDDFVTPLGGLGFFDIDNDTLPNEATLYSSGFSACDDLLVEGNGILAGVDLSMSYMPIYNNTGRVNSLSPRIKLWRLSVGPIVDWPMSFFNSYTDDFDSGIGISWTDQLKSEYALIANAIKKNRQITCEFNLSKLDVIGFDFSNFIYVEQLKSTFFVIKIENYRPERTTKCTLLKLN